MSVLDLNLDDITTPSYLPDGSEQELRILEVSCNISQKGNPYLRVNFESIAHPDAEEVQQILGLPNETMDAKRLRKCKERLRSFFNAFSITPSTDTDLMPGATGWVIVGVENDPQYGERNFIKKFL